LTFEQLGERVGISKGTVSKIFSEEDENGNPAYKELHIMWEVLGSKEQILKYGRENLKNKQQRR
jgi:transcriptional regulator with XRE-family HTH domain